MPNNYYIILGVSTNSSQGDIKAAYRRLAKKCHPDCCEEGHTRFQVIQEAYSVLGNPEKRRAYDHQRYKSRKTGRRRAGGIRVEPMRSRSEVEKEPSNETFFKSYFSDFIDRNEVAGVWVRDTAIEVGLSPEQASRGGHVRFTVPVRIQCPDCNGHGVRLFGCWRCYGFGYMAKEYPAAISYPPGIMDNEKLLVSLDHFEAGTLNLTVRFRVG